MLSLCLWRIAGGILRGAPALRALSAFVAAQSALLFGYALWGGVKEVGAAAFVALAAALASAAVHSSAPRRAAALLALPAGALVGVLSLGGLVWLAPMLLALGYLAWRDFGGRDAAAQAASFALAAAVFALPVHLPGGFSPFQSGLTAESEIGNPLRPRPCCWRSPARYYEVWQRPLERFGALPEHHGYGGEDAAAAVPDCGEIGGIGLLALNNKMPSPRLLAAHHAPVYDAGDGILTLPRAGRHEAWLGGSVRGSASLYVDGRPIGEARHELQNDGGFAQLSEARLALAVTTSSCGWAAPTCTPAAAASPARRPGRSFSPHTAPAPAASSPCRSRNRAASAADRGTGSRRWAKGGRDAESYDGPVPGS